MSVHDWFMHPFLKGWADWFRLWGRGDLEPPTILDVIGYLLPLICLLSKRTGHTLLDSKGRDMKAFTLGKPQATSVRSVTLVWTHWNLLRELQPSLNPWKELSFYRTQIWSIHSIFPICAINVCKNPCLGIRNCNPYLPLRPALSLSRCPRSCRKH